MTSSSGRGKIREGAGERQPGQLGDQVVVFDDSVEDGITFTESRFLRDRATFVAGALGLASIFEVSAAGAVSRAQ